ncbi:peptide chain release factor N(5)-glutamine methyltransferase [Patescibacteria group bacterium]|nr:peptide chain release factor N(5)-glutamine methyltransferase [Patescibacteria group bacterium]
MNIKQALQWGADKLKKNTYLNTYFLDAEILLSYAINKPKEFLFAHPEKKLAPAQLAKYKKIIAHRAKREPIAYITGKKEFYSRNFLVSPAVLIPRPDTETLIDVAKKTVGGFAPYSTIIDIGAGSGAIAITLKKEFPRARVIAIEISPEAIKLARKNAHALNAKITIKKGDLLSPFLYEQRLPLLIKKNLIITANLPYLSEKGWREAQPEVKKYEPKGALVGGKTGTELYEKLFKQIRELVTADKGDPCKALQGSPLSATLLIEIGATQKTQITKLLKEYLKPKKIEAFKDLSGKWRVINCKL